MQGVLSVALNQAVDDRLIPSNPAARVKKAAARGERPMRSLTQEEASRLVAAAMGSRYEALIVVALRTGMRQGELAALKWQDVDLEGPRPAITVRHSADTRISPPQITPTKTGKDRRVRIGPRTVEVLKAHRARQRFERLRARSWENPELVFPNTRDEIRRSGSVRKSLRRLLKKADFPETERVRIHDLRHTAGTLALRQGMTLHAVSKMLGHADPVMTLRRYAHVLEDMEDEAAGRWTSSSSMGRRRNRERKPTNLVCNAGRSDPTFYPNRPQQRSTQADSLQEAIAEISPSDGALSNTERPLGTLR